MKLKQLLIAAFLLTTASSCIKEYDNLLQNPNYPSLSAADPDLYLNDIQLGFKDFYSDASNQGGLLTRQETLFGITYYNAFTPSSFDNEWAKAYMAVLKSANAMMAPATEAGLTTHTGIAKTLQAYTMITLVDYFGDVPYSEALLGAENTTPAVDNGADVYAAALALLDDAIEDFGTAPTKAPASDLFYAGDRAKWTAAAKTIKLKALMSTRLVDAGAKDKIAALIAENDLIDTEAEDFTFKFGTKVVSPDSRHPKFANDYTGTAAGNTLGTYFMWALYAEKSMIDPRIRYYLYRQTDDIVAAIPNQTDLQFTVPCLFRSSPYPAGVPYCMVGTAYLGRDHGNGEGSPPDGTYRTVYGVYPAGGAFDADQAKDRGDASVANGRGAGIFPIWLSSYTDFLKAEAVLTLGLDGDVNELVESGIRKSFAKVFAFPAALGVTVPETFVPSEGTQDDYVDIVKDQLSAAATSDAKLNVVMKEYYLSAFGNGIETYNNYRRTGKPDNMQPMLDAANAGSFIRSFFYPSSAANLNPNVTQKTTTTVKVFWDNNPDNFIN
ncbi:MAG: SusD/RagB family nutrient-binding outer membrane lipoprotein [Flavihumibacter sp.]